MVILFILFPPSRSLTATTLCTSTSCLKSMRSWYQWLPAWFSFLSWPSLWVSWCSSQRKRRRPLDWVCHVHCSTLHLLWWLNPWIQCLCNCWKLGKQFHRIEGAHVVTQISVFICDSQVKIFFLKPDSQTKLTERRPLRLSVFLYCEIYVSILPFWTVGLSLRAQVNSRSSDWRGMLLP